MEKNRYSVLVSHHSLSSRPPQPPLFLVQLPLLGSACLHHCPVITEPPSRRLLSVVVNKTKPFVGRVPALSSRFLPCQCTRGHRGPMCHQEDHPRGSLQSQWAVPLTHINTSLTCPSKKKMVHLMFHSMLTHK